MKKTITAICLASLFCAFASAQNGNNTYEKLWEEVDSSITSRWPKTALKTLQTIEALATADNNNVQLIKVSIYKARIAATFEEDYLITTIADFEKKITESEVPDKNIYYSLTAQLYECYFMNNEWSIGNRANVTEKTDDIATWSREDFKNKCYEYYLKSVENAATLVKTPIENYNAILSDIKDVNTREFRPSLYELLAFRALDFLSNNENNLLGASITNAKALLPYSTFSKTLIDDSFSESPMLIQSLKLFQNIINLHPNDVPVLIDTELARLDFVYANMSYDERDADYLSALFSLERNFANHPAAADVMFTIADYYNSHADANDLNTTYAVEYCRKAIEKHPDSHGGILCYNMLQELTKESINNVSIAETNYPDEKFPATVSYTNCAHLYFRVVGLDSEEAFKYRYTDKDINLMSQKIIEQWDIAVDNGNDYKEHSVQIIIPELSAGDFALIVCNDKNFDKKTSEISCYIFQVSQVDFILSSIYNTDKYELLVCDRNSGKPIKNCTVEIYKSIWQSSSRQKSLSIVKTATTNSDGKIIFTANDELKGNPIFRIRYSDKDNFSQNTYLYKDNNEPKTNTRAYLYTDRAIYRPGQTIYFKGILAENKGNDYSVIPNSKVTVTFKDTNYKNLKSQDFTSNEFGSFTGSFTIPSDCLTGSFRIQTKFGSLSVQVEEYKRPTFEITFEKASKENKMNSEVCVNLNAETYTGLSLNGAKVSYTVTRKTNFFPWFRHFFYDNSPTTIDSGTATLDENGKASICFIAKCPKNKSYRYNPIYSFEISATVTAATGETITDTFTVNVSEGTIALYSDIPEYPSTIKIEAHNIDGETVETSMRITISKLQAPANPLRPSINQTPPDKFVYSQKEFNDLLPKDQYLDEQDYTKWIKGKELKKFTCNDGIIDVNSLSLETGYYVIEATTKDGYGKTVSENFYFNVCVKGDTPTFNKSGIILFTDKTTAQPDDDINILLATSKSALVRVFIVSETRIILDDLIPIKDNKTINIKVSESDRGTIKVFAYSIFDNRQYSESLSIKIPFINKDLDIRLLTEREYIEPNAQEKWKISITNINGIEKNAEVLASMYDMSLDFFITSDYNIGKSGSYSSISRSPFYNSGDFLAYRSYAYRRKIDTKDNIYYTYDNIIEIPEICMSRFFYKTSARNNLSMACCVSDDVIVEAEDTQFVKADTSAGEIAGSEEVPTQRAERSVRRDFRETAFFYPQLKTDEDGTVSFEFTAPESLTKWKFRILAHTKDMSSGYFESEIITQKDIFIQANQPKVLYENDVIDYTARIANLSEKVQSGTAFIKVFDKNGKDITSEVIESNGQKTFSLKSKASQTATWRLTVPKNASILKIRTGADTGSCSDAEEYTIPVLTTKVLITETLPITVNKKGINNYVFKGLRDKFTNNSYSTQSVTLEYSPNPVWYAVQALPYMSDNGNDIFCEQIFGKLYSNLIAGYIIKHNPKIEEVYKQIAASTPDEFISELEKNQELKDILLSETPWVLEAEDEQQQRERLALLFDYNQMSYNISTFANKLSSMQQSDGGFPWIQGMTYPSFYTTLYIITGFCHLMDINIINYGDNGTIKNIIAKGVSFLDSEIVETYDTMKSDKTLDSYHISSSMVSYLYMRSFISDKIVVSNSTKEAYDFFYNKALKGYNSLDLSSQAMAAILFQRSNNNKEAQFLMQSFNERALHSEELGMYWRDLQSTYSYNASIEAAALMIECYAALTNDSGSINEIQRWLLNRKRTTIWETTRATTEAIYALLIGNSAKIAGDYANDAVVIGKKSVDMEGAIPGSGYVKASWIGEEVTKDFANISIEKTSDGTAWASVYWQYLTDYANVTSASAGLSVERKIMRGSLAGDKIVYSEYPSISVIRATDNVIVRMIVKVDRDMEYVHLKDILPACFIPKETISGYRYENGLWYYLNIKDESVNYYIERLSKGTYVIDYHVNIQQSGKFNAGISKIQCMYAPEFCGQSEGSIIFVKD